MWGLAGGRKCPVMSKQAYTDLNKVLCITPMFIQWIQLKVITASHALYRMDRNMMQRSWF
uniref:Uncharacterized protein n=1 Tax=Lepeophtheirus salmonis TaxID=72036 RepID=A0A0K2UYG5_LEPSM